MGVGDRIAVFGRWIVDAAHHVEWGRAAARRTAA
jgi:hypothetical protein